jgi:hypothetical protein
LQIHRPMHSSPSSRRSRSSETADHCLPCCQCAVTSAPDLFKCTCWSM